MHLRKKGKIQKGRFVLVPRSARLSRKRIAAYFSAGKKFKYVIFSFFLRVDRRALLPDHTKQMELR